MDYKCKIIDKQYQHPLTASVASANDYEGG